MNYRDAAITCAMILSLLGGSLPALAVSDTELMSREAAQAVTISDVTMQPDGRVSGVLHNNSPKPLRDVRLLIRYIWYWKTERTPGEDSPGRAMYYTAPDEIAPGGQAPFTYPPPAALPARTDGRFRPRIEVVGFTEVGE